MGIRRGENGNSPRWKWEFAAVKMGIHCSENGNSPRWKWEFAAEKIRIHRGRFVYLQGKTLATPVMFFVCTEKHSRSFNIIGEVYLFARRNSHLKSSAKLTNLEIKTFAIHKKHRRNLFASVNKNTPPTGMRLKDDKSKSGWSIRESTRFTEADVTTDRTRRYT